jgi:hypothetical protein
MRSTSTWGFAVADVVPACFLQLRICAAHCLSMIALLADYLKSSSNSPTCASPVHQSSFRLFDPQRGSTGAGSAAAASSYNNSSAGNGSNAGIQGNAVTPPSLSAPTSARGMLPQGSYSNGDGSYSGGGGSSQRQQQPQQQKVRQPSLEGSPAGREGSGTGPLEYGSPPLVSRSGSWSTLNNPQQQQQNGSVAGSVASILSRPPSALSGMPPAAAGGSGSTSGSGSSLEADPAKRSKLADYYHARGYAARKQGNFKGAVEEYTRALALSPTHFKALFNRGFSYDKVRPAAAAGGVKACHCSATW